MKREDGFLLGDPDKEPCDVCGGPYDREHAPLCTRRCSEPTCGLREGHDGDHEVGWWADPDEMGDEALGGDWEDFS